MVKQLFLILFFSMNLQAGGPPLPYDDSFEIEVYYRQWWEPRAEHAQLRKSVAAAPEPNPQEVEQKKREECFKKIQLIPKENGLYFSLLPPEIFKMVGEKYIKEVYSSK